MKYYTVLPRPLTKRYLTSNFPTKLSNGEIDKLLKLVNVNIETRDEFKGQKAVFVSWGINDGTLRMKDLGWMPLFETTGKSGEDFYLRRKDQYTRVTMKDEKVLGHAHRNWLYIMESLGFRKVSPKKYIGNSGTVYNLFEMHVDGGVDTKWLYKLSCGEIIYYSGKGAETVAKRIFSKGLATRQQLINIHG